MALKGSGRSVGRKTSERVLRSAAARPSSGRRPRPRPPRDRTSKGTRRRSTRGASTSQRRDGSGGSSDSYSSPSLLTLPSSPSATTGAPGAGVHVRPKFITARADNETPDALAPRRFLRGRRAIFRRDARVGRRKLFLFLRARVGVLARLLEF